MIGQKFILVTYDISDDRRRTRLHDLLLDYGTPVQYSVFECLLEAKRIEQMQGAVRRIIHPRSDHVRYYRLCRNCVRRIEVTSGVEALGGPEETVVV